jgi:KUP system potassium uptake protein
VRTEEVPYVEAGGRLQLDRSEPGLLRIDVRFGFREEPDLPAALALAASQGLDIDPMTTTYFIARSVVQDRPGELSAWRCALYAWMTRQAEGAAAYLAAA